MAAIPVEQCLGAVDLTEPRLHPDGSRLLYARTARGEAELVLHHLPDDRTQVLVGPLADQPHATVAPRVGRGFGGGCWCWTAAGDAVVYSGADGNLWWRPLEGAPPRRLTDAGPDRVAQAPVAVPDGRRVVYVVDQAEVWSVHLDGSDPQRLDDGTADFCFDPWPDPDGGGVRWLAWNVPDMPWDRARVAYGAIATGATGELVPRHSVQQPRALPDGRGVAVRDDHGWLNVWIDERPLIDEPFEHAGPTWGLGQRSYCWSPDGRWVAFTRNERGFGRLCVVGVDGGPVHEIGRGVHGQLSWEGNRLAALRSGARTPTQVVVYEHGATPDGPWTRRTVAVGPSSAWSDTPLVEPEPVEFRAPDGAELHARLYRAEAPTGRLICWLHGGPTDQWQVTFLPRVAFWRSRGYHVLVVDHRGSTGHGRAYQQALRTRWGELDVVDTVAALQHAHEGGLAAPAGTVLMGGSAGGFTVLGTVRAAPHLVAAAVVVSPVSDLADLTERSHRFERHSTVSLVADPDEQGADDVYRHRSPVWFADRITAPLLVFHGADDPVVPVGQSRLLVERIRAAGGEATLHVYAGEGHGIRRPEHQRDEYERTESFLRRHVRGT